MDWRGMMVKIKIGQNEVEVGKDLEEFEKELAALINKYSLENLSDTPDFILASFMVQAMLNFNHELNARARWYQDVPPAKFDQEGEDGQEED